VTTATFLEWTATIPDVIPRLGRGLAWGFLNLGCRTNFGPKSADAGVEEQRCSFVLGVAGYGRWVAIQGNWSMVPPD
jgi:hypothetical protein